MELTSYYLAIIEKKLVMLAALLAYFLSLPNSEAVLAVGYIEQTIEIWKKLSSCGATVKFHIRNVYGKLQLNSRDGMVRKYGRAG